MKERNLDLPSTLVKAIALIQEAQKGGSCNQEMAQEVQKGLSDGPLKEMLKKILTKNHGGEKSDKMIL